MCVKFYPVPFFCTLVLSLTWFLERGICLCGVQLKLLFRLINFCHFLGHFNVATLRRATPDNPQMQSSLLKLPPVTITKVGVPSNQTLNLTVTLRLVAGHPSYPITTTMPDYLSWPTHLQQRSVRKTLLRGDFPAVMSPNLKAAFRELAKTILNGIW